MNRRQRIIASTVAASCMLCAAGATVAIAAPRSTSGATPPPGSASVDPGVQARLRAQLAALDAESSALQRQAAATAAKLAKARLAAQAASTATQSVGRSTVAKPTTSRTSGSSHRSSEPAAHKTNAPQSPAGHDLGESEGPEHGSEPEHD